MERLVRRITYILAIACAWLALFATCEESVFGQAENSQVEFRFENIGDTSLKLWQGNQPVLAYNFGQMPPPKGAAAAARSSYVHPLYGLGGEVLTDDFPKDHYHHHGLFWGWPHVTIDGTEYDLWKMHGIDIKFKRWLKKEIGKDGAEIGVENTWQVNGTAVANEEVSIHVRPATLDGRLIGLTLKWTPLGKPITLGGAAGKSYGGVSLRFAPREKTVITVPSGPTSEDLLISNLPWADLSARFKGSGSDSGAALFVAPRHPGFPPEWMTRDYGLVAVGWPGVKPQTLEVGKTVTCSYGLWIHRGRVDAAKIQSVYDANFPKGAAPRNSSR